MPSRLSLAYLVPHLLAAVGIAVVLVVPAAAQPGAPARGIAGPGAECGGGMETSRRTASRSAASTATAARTC